MALALAYSKQLQSMSIESHFRLSQVGERLRFGAGARLSVFGADTARLSTAKASDISSDRVEAIESDRLLLSSLNAMLFSEIELSKEYSLSLNVDVVGFSFGRSVQLSGQSQSAPGTPSSFNLLVFDKYDRGTLNSHFLLRRKLSEQLYVSAGLAHQFVEYTSQKSFVFDNRRFRMRNDSLVLVLGKIFE